MHEEYIKLNPIAHVDGVLNLPGSKSISNRALLLAAQAKGTTYLTNLLDSDDVRYMLTALKQFGINFYLSNDRRSCKIDGIGKFLQINSSLTLFLGNAGTAMRSLTAALCLQKQKIILTGDQRMKERPIGHLVNALQQGGAKIEYINQKDYPPLCLYGGYRGGKININSNISSQFLTALLIMAPLAPEDSYIYIKGELVSKPYIDITLALMKKFGVEIYNEDYNFFYLKGNCTYNSPGDYLIEGDASSASYFLSAAAIRGGTVRVTGIGRNSIQGDIYFADVLKKMGAIINWGNNYIECSYCTLNSIDMDMNHIPDAAMTIAITGLFTKKGVTTLRNIYNWRVKETDRLTAMSTELRKVGATVIEGSNYLSIIPPVKFISAKINTYNDHRIAMCFALVALSDVSITILNPQCTRKTFPNFFEQFAKICILK